MPVNERKACADQMQRGAGGTLFVGKREEAEGEGGAVTAATAKPQTVH